MSSVHQADSPELRPPQVKSDAEFDGLELQGNLGNKRPPGITGDGETLTHHWQVGNAVLRESIEIIAVYLIITLALPAMPYRSRTDAIGES